MNKHKNSSARHTRNGAFVMLLIEIIDAPAWRAMSHGAKSLYIALRRRYNATIDNNGRIYLPQRVAQKELHSKRDQIVRWFRELQHYGFIEIVSAGYLGLNGYGRAARWRLTELPCNSEPPTKDFLAWNGIAFGKQKTEARSRKRDHCGPENGTRKTRFSRVPPGPEKGTREPVPKRGPNLDSSSHVRGERMTAAGGWP
jgi:hypothetical protein